MRIGKLCLLCLMWFTKPTSVCPPKTQPGSVQCNVDGCDCNEGPFLFLLCISSSFLFPHHIPENSSVLGLHLQQTPSKQPSCVLHHASQEPDHISSDSSKSHSTISSFGPQLSTFHSMDNTQEGVLKDEYYLVTPGDTTNAVFSSSSSPPPSQYLLLTVARRFAFCPTLSPPTLHAGTT